MKNIIAALVCLVFLLLNLEETSIAKTLKASHQWPGGKQDIRDEMIQMIARDINRSNSELTVKVYPGKSLYKPKEQWGALVKGRLDISAFPLAYAANRHPVFDITLMPGLVKNHAHAKRLNDSEFMTKLRSIIEKAGAIVLADAWLAGGFVSKGKCILEPKTIKGQVTRAAGKSFELMLAGSQASIASMPSSEIYTAMQTGILDAANTSSSSLISYRIYEQANCLTAPGKHTLWFMYEPILMSKRSWQKLTKNQQESLRSAGKKAEIFFDHAAQKLDDDLVRVFKKAGVKVTTMNEKQAASWQAIAEKTSYKQFRDRVPGGHELLKQALSVH